ncbi:MAG: GNAT family N-acetyltransferase, partial [Pseudomonadota bacterium]
IRAPRADAIFLQRVRDDANIRPFLERLGALGTEANQAPYIDLSGFASFEDYDGAMFTRRKQRERKRLRRRLDEMGPVTLDRGLTGEAARAGATAAIVLKRRWLAEKSLASKALTDDRSLGFMADIAADAESGVDTRVNVLKSGETTAGAQIGFAYKGTLSMHVIVYDLRFQKAGVGVLHLADKIEQAFEDGLDRIDLLAPTADYKRTWATGAVGVSDYCYGANRRGRLFVSLYLKRIRPVLKTIAPMVPLSLRKQIRTVAASVGV